jgi:hypothetical protein
MEEFRMSIPAALFFTVQADSAKEALEIVQKVQKYLLDSDDPLATPDLGRELDGSQEFMMPAVWVTYGEPQFEDIGNDDEQDDEAA